MRLTCPKCAAQYEVPEAAIPAAGREVQCSGCGTVWFQAPPDPVAPAPPEASEPISTAEDPAPASEAAPPPQRRLDPSVADILRAEADRERSARAAEAGGSVTAEPAPLPDTGDASLSGQQPDGPSQPRATSAPSQGGGAAPQADPYPDIEDMTPSADSVDAARASLAPGSHDDTPSGRSGHGFRTGFLLAVLTCGMALAVYLWAGDIARLVPAAEQGLAGYVEAIDTARAVLADTVEDLLARL